MARLTPIDGPGRAVQRQVGTVQPWLQEAGRVNHMGKLRQGAEGRWAGWPLTFTETSAAKTSRAEAPPAATGQATGAPRGQR